MYLPYWLGAHLRPVQPRVLFVVHLAYECAARSTLIPSSGRVGRVTYTLSPLIMYNPRGTISTPWSVENSRSMQSDKIRFVRTSKPRSFPYYCQRLAIAIFLGRSGKTNDDDTTIVQYHLDSF
jgi:hypothetical protein